MKKELWLRLARYHFDNLVPPHLADRVLASFGGADASTKAFGSKLARKLGWTNAFSLHAIREYKKFVYLGVVSEFSVTPPKVIDQVWHEHLLFSRPYREFCRDVLERDFDHNPELVPASGQTDVFEAQYDATLALYRQEFNAEPPGEIWGTPKFNAARTGQVVPPRRQDSGSTTLASYEDTPLHIYFDASGGGGDSHSSVPEFGGGGGFSGGGGGSLWGDHSTPADSGAPDGGHGSGDSDSGGSSSSSGSSCSSSCGGGGGGCSS